MWHGRCQTNWSEYFRHSQSEWPKREMISICKSCVDKNNFLTSDVNILTVWQDGKTTVDPISCHYNQVAVCGISSLSIKHLNLEADGLQQLKDYTRCEKEETKVIIETDSPKFGFTDSINTSWSNVFILIRNIQRAGVSWWPLVPVKHCLYTTVR